MAIESLSYKGAGVSTILKQSKNSQFSNFKQVFIDVAESSDKILRDYADPSTTTMTLNGVTVDKSNSALVSFLMTREQEENMRLTQALTDIMNAVMDYLKKIDSLIQ